MMSDFIQALLNPHVPFLRYALIGGILASMSFGVMGTYVVVQRISYVAGAISHAVLGGIGVALYLNRAKGLEFILPIHGALAAALLAALAVGIVSVYAKQREDTALGALWATGMAVGMIFLARTPGYVDPMSYLFGNILIMSKQDLWMIAGLDVLVLAVVAVFYNQFAALVFDQEFAMARGLRVGVYSMLMLCLAALAVVLMVGTVGIVMVVALLTLPAAIASLFCRSLKSMMVVSAVLCMVFTTAGLGFSYTSDLPTGPSIIVIAGLVYLSTLVGVRIRRRVVGPVRAGRSSVRDEAGCQGSVCDEQSIKTRNHHVQG